MASPEKAGRIAVVGSNMVDLITYIDRMPEPGETLEAPSFESGCGGKGTNQAVAAAKLGSAVSMVTKVGDDLFGDNTIRNFSDHGIDTRHVAKVAGKSSGVAPIFVEESGENSILIVKGANADLLPADVDAAEETLREADLILMQLEIPLETIYHTVRRAAEWGVPTILNPAPATKELSVADLKSLGFLVPNESELSLLSGMPTGTEQPAPRMPTRTPRPMPAADAPDSIPSMLTALTPPLEVPGRMVQPPPVSLTVCVCTHRPLAEVGSSCFTLMNSAPRRLAPNQAAWRIDVSALKMDPSSLAWSNLAPHRSVLENLERSRLAPMN